MYTLLLKLIPIRLIAIAIAGVVLAQYAGVDLLGMFYTFLQNEVVNQFSLF